MENQLQNYQLKNNIDDILQDSKMNNDQKFSTFIFKANPALPFIYKGKIFTDHNLALWLRNIIAGKGTKEDDKVFKEVVLGGLWRASLYENFLVETKRMTPEQTEILRKKLGYGLDHICKRTPFPTISSAYLFLLLVNEDARREAIDSLHKKTCAASSRALKAICEDSDKWVEPINENNLLISLFLKYGQEKMKGLIQKLDEGIPKKELRIMVDLVQYFLVFTEEIDNSDIVNVIKERIEVFKKNCRDILAEYVVSDKNIYNEIRRYLKNDQANLNHFKDGVQLVRTLKKSLLTKVLIKRNDLKAKLERIHDQLNKISKIEVIDCSSNNEYKLVINSHIEGFVSRKALDLGSVDLDWLKEAERILQIPKPVEFIEKTSLQKEIVANIAALESLITENTENVSKGQERGEESEKAFDSAKRYIDNTPGGKQHKLVMLELLGKYINKPLNALDIDDFQWNKDASKILSIAHSEIKSCIDSIKDLEESIKQVATNIGRDSKKELVDKLRTYDSTHPLVRRHEKEEKLLSVFKGQRIGQLEEEEIQKIREVKDDLKRKVAKEKAEVRRRHKLYFHYGDCAETAGRVGLWIGGILWVIWGIGAWLEGCRSCRDIVEGIGLLILVPIIAGISGVIVWVISWVIGWVIGIITSPIKESIGADREAAKVLYPSEEENILIKGIKKEISNKKASLDKQILKKIYQMTDEEIDKKLQEQKEKAKQEKAQKEKLAASLENNIIEEVSLTTNPTQKNNNKPMIAFIVVCLLLGVGIIVYKNYNYIAQFIHHKILIDDTSSLSSQSLRKFPQNQSTSQKLGTTGTFIVLPPTKEPEAKQYRLFVKTKPENAGIRILNIKPKFFPGIALKPGTYHIEVSSNGYETQKKWIELNAGEEQTFAFELLELSKKEPAPLAVVPDVNHNIEVNGQPKKEPNIEPKLQPKPEPKSIKVSIQSAPSGASVMINNKLKGSTPFSIALDDGAYGIHISMKKYKPVWDILKIKKNGKKDFFYTLKAE